MKKRVVVTGLGVCSSIGIGYKKFWENVKNGVSGISEVSSYDTSRHLSKMGGEITNFNPEEFLDKRKLKFISRGAQLTYVASKLAIEDSKFDKNELQRKVVGFCLGTTLGELPALEHIDRAWISSGIEFIDKTKILQFPTPNMAYFTALEYKLTGPIRVFTTACAAGNYAISHSVDLICNGEVDFCLAGGADAFSWIPFTGFNQFRSVAPEKCQPFDKNRKGMIVGEGAGIMVLESYESAKNRKVPIYAEILGCGFSCDAYHVTNTQLEGIYNCMSDALIQTGISANDIDYICAHGTGTKQNDRAEAGAINKLLGGRTMDVSVSSIKSMIGHTMGAASAIEAIVCCLVVKNDIVPPTINFETLDPECVINCVPNLSINKTVNVALNNGFAFGGNNSCLVLSKLM